MNKLFRQKKAPEVTPEPVKKNLFLYLLYFTIDSIYVNFGLIDIHTVIYNSGSAIKSLPVKFIELNKLTSPYALRVTKDYDSFTVNDYHTSVASKPVSTTEIYVFLKGY